MSMQDPISDMLTRIRNGQMARLKTVDVPSSKVKLAILAVLKEEGYITDFAEYGEVKRIVTVTLKFFQGKAVMDKIKRISKPSLRKYSGAEDLKIVNAGMGMSIVSTSQGIMSDSKARNLNLGGEVICEIM